MPLYRLFLAATPPHDLQDAIAAVGKALSPKVDGVKWVAAPNIHLTIKFFGDTPSERIEDILAVVRPRLADRAPFEVSLGDVGAFPHLNAPNVLWIGLTPQEPLIAMHRSLEMGLFAADFDADKKPFNAHLTFGRVKRGMKGQKIRKAVEKLGEVAIGLWRVDALQLYRSRLTPDGPIYSTLETIPFGGETD